MQGGGSGRGSRFEFMYVTTATLQAGHYVFYLALKSTIKVRSSHLEKNVENVPATQVGVRRKRTRENHFF